MLKQHLKMYGFIYAGVVWAIIASLLISSHNSKFVDQIEENRAAWREWANACLLQHTPERCYAMKQLNLPLVKGE